MTAIVVGALVSGCAGPARTDGSYGSKAAATAEQARSSVETVIVVVEGTARHGLPTAYVSVTVAEAETDASSALSGFESVQPPSSTSDAVRRRTTAVVGDAVDLLSEARILARRGAGRPLEALLPELRRSSVRLDAVATSVGA